MPVSGTIDELEGILKTTYVGSVNEQMAEDNMFLMKLEAYGMKVPVDGTTPKFNLQYSRSGGIGFRDTSSTVPLLPDARTGRHKQGTVSIKELYGREEFTIIQVESAKGAGAFVGTITDKTEQMIRDFRDAYGISLYTNTKGAITTATAAVLVGTPLVVAVADKVRLQEGNVVDIIDATDGAVLVRKALVASFDDENNLVTFDLTDATKGTGTTAATTLYGAVLGTGANVAIASGDYIVFEESYNLSYAGLEEQVLETGTLHGIDRSSDVFYTSSLKDIGNVVITNKFIRLVKNSILRKSRRENGYALDCGLGNYDEISGFEDTLDDNVRYDVMSGDKAPGLIGGYNVLKHDNLDIIGDRYATAHKLFLLSTESFMLYQTADTKFLDMGEGIFNRNYQKAQYEFTLYNYQNLVSYNLRANGALTNVKGLSE